jgi:SAM-dependent methyltransferase/peptidoglycan/xylan/chitin deacetylase (PgdA/CDA1 family)
MLIFRLDDYSAASRIRLEIDEVLFQIFRAHKIPLTVAVTPQMVSDVHDPECQSFAELGTDLRRVDMLKEGLDAGWEMAMHGLTHRRSPVRDCTEFAMSSWRVQTMRMDEGRSKLLSWFPSVSLRVFVPPWNSYDSNTVKAAAANAFEVLCVGPEAKAMVRSGVRIIPSAMTIDDLLTFLQLFSLSRFIRDLNGSSIVVTLHEYEFKTDGRPNWARLRILDSVISAIARSQVPCGTVSRAIPANCNVSHHSDLNAALTFLRRLQSPSGRRLTSVIGRIEPGRARDFAERVMSNSAFFSSIFTKTMQVARDRARPTWRSLLKTRNVIAGRLRSGPRHTCPFCGYVGSFGPMGDRPHGLCIKCGSLERHRFILAGLGPALGRLFQRHRALMMAPDPLLSMLRDSFDQVIAGDIAQDRKVDAKFDLQRLPFREGAFDLILATHVLDEIEDDRAALRECHRCLSDGGWLVAPVPIHEHDETIELDERQADGKFRLAGRDYFRRIEAEGFVSVLALDPMDEIFTDLNQRQNIRTPGCLIGTEGLVVFEKRPPIEVRP